MPLIPGQSVLFVAALSAATALCQVPSTATIEPAGRISGTIQTTNGQPVANALVSINVRPIGPSASFPVFNTTATTAEDGAFAVTRVPSGKFAVCPAVPNTNLLPPCTWGSEITVTVSSGQSVVIPPIQLQQGADFYVRVNDPNKTLAATAGKVPGAGLMIGVQSPTGAIVPVPVTASDASGFDHHLAAPTATNLLFVVFSGSLSMTDAAGVAISNQHGLTVPINIPANQAQFKQVVNIK